MNRRWRFLILPVITLALEILPWGAVCNFANPDGEPWRRTFSYFDPTPFGYANFAPFLTAIVTCAVVISLLVYAIADRPRAKTVATALLCAGLVLSLCPLLSGINYFSLVGALITVTLFAELVLLLIPFKRSKSIDGNETSI